jgi:hypothetical protein
MRLPILTPTKGKFKQKLFTFRRLNKMTMISDDELSDASNISWKNAPALSCRPSRETLYTLTTPKSLTSAGTKLAWVDGTNFKYDNSTEGTVTASMKSYADLNQKLFIFPDTVSYDYLTDTFATMVAASPAETDPDVSPAPTVEIPAIVYACTHNNRIFGVFNSTIVACALGNGLSWQFFYPPDAQNSYAIDWDTEGGSFTGIVSYQNHVILFKQNYMYELYNVNPPYNIQRVNKVGCIGNNAIVEVGLVLYFVGAQYIYSYSGGLPRPISEVLNVTYTDAVLGADDRFLYANLKTGASTWTMFVYDTLTGAWAQEDTIQMLQMTKLGGKCIGLASDGKIVKANSGTESGIAWSFTTKPFTADAFNTKGMNKVRIIIDLATSSTAKLYYKLDGGSFVEAASFSTVGEKVYITNIPLTPADKVTLKLTGTGEYTFKGIQVEYWMGEDG